MRNRRRGAPSIGADGNSSWLNFKTPRSQSTLFDRPRNLTRAMSRYSTPCSEIAIIAKKDPNVNFDIRTSRSDILYLFTMRSIDTARIQLYFDVPCAHKNYIFMYIVC